MARAYHMLNRREFLRSGLAGSGLMVLNGVAPAFLKKISGALPVSSERILVVLQLSGGNDGLNTIVPYRDPIYYARRPKLAIPAADVLKIDDHFGFHPSMRGAADLLESGQLAIVQGVGYPQPNRSHFESMDIWHTCLRKDQPRRDGWLGRYLEQSEIPRSLPALHIGQEQQPLALASRTVRVPSIGSFDEFRWEGADRVRSRLEALLEKDSRSDDDLLAFVQANSKAALEATRQLTTIGAQHAARGAYPRTPLGERLAAVAQLIGAELKARIYYLTLDGFDTHAQQIPAHAGLLQQWSTGVKAFFDELAAQGNASRVLLFSFSEFGRRVQENASEGTDHGAAAPVYLAGPAVRAGVHGPLPSLEDLEDGDLKYHTDFRQVYATILEHWFGLKDGSSILGGRYSTLPILQTG